MNEQQRAPVAVFAYNRDEHLQRTLSALAKNLHAAETDVFLFVDGPKNEYDRLKQVGIFRFSEGGIAKSFKSIRVIASSTNKGLARSIIEGVTGMLREHETVIVLEDDLVTSPFFLRFMNEGLLRYWNEERVVSIHGFVHPLPDAMTQSFFLRGADCWGWATWRRGWALFEPDGSRLLQELDRGGEVRRFDFEGKVKYRQMLKDQISGKNNSWAIRWYASAFLKNKLTLYPPVSLVENIGLDGSGTHCESTFDYGVALASGPVVDFPGKIEESPGGYRAYCKFHESIRPTFLQRLFARIRRLRGRL
jgi:hypothetical protein